MPLVTQGPPRRHRASGLGVRCDRPGRGHPGANAGRAGRSSLAGLRARVSTWPPLRLARLRLERGSVGVVCPPALPPSIHRGEVWWCRVDASGLMCIASSRRSPSGRPASSGRSDRSRRRRRRCGSSPTVWRRATRSRWRRPATRTRSRGCSKRVWRASWWPTRPRPRAIAEAKVKTDKVDAEVLAQLLAADYLPGVWLPDDETHALRRQVHRRAHIVRQRTRLKNGVHGILHRNLVPRCPAADLFGKKGRAWLAEQQLPVDERQAAE